MTVNVVVLYPHPRDPDSFDDHYLTSHMPLANTIPGVRSTSTGRFLGAPDGSPSPYYWMTVMEFDDAESATAAFASEQGRAAAADYASFAPDGSMMLLLEATKRPADS